MSDNDISPEIFDIDPQGSGPGHMVGGESLNDEPPSIDDALERAFAAAGGKADDEPEPKAEEKPTEDKAEKPAKDEKAEAEEPPAKEPKPRAQDGKFAAKAVDGDAPKAEVKPTAYAEAPSRFDDAAKKEWETTPESVRGAIHRAHRELEAGIQKYKADAEAFEPLRKYDAMAKQAGTTVHAALDRYVQMDQMLRQNPMAGIERIVADMGLRRNDGSAVTFRDIAQTYLNRSPVENQNASLQAELAMIKQAQQQQAQQMEADRQARERESLLSTARAEMPRLDELRPAMIGLIQSGAIQGGASDIEIMRAAYAEASRLYPIAAHTSAPDALAQTQTTRQPNPDGRKSITGAPSTNTQTGSRKKAVPSIDDALEAALRRVS